MASTYTTNLHVELQGTGDNSGTWGSVLNTTALSIIDQCLGDVQTVSLSSSNVTLTTAQSQHNYFKLTGILTANVTVTFPAVGRTIYVYNSTSGAYSVTFANAGGGTSVLIPQNNGLFLTMDGTNVVADPIPFGTLQSIAGGTTIDLGAAPARNVSVTGSGWTCTSFGSSASTTSPVYLINFVATGTLTYNATSMILPGAANISVAAGDSCMAVYLGSGNWRVISYTSAATAGLAGLANSAGYLTNNGSGVLSWTNPALNTQTFSSSGTWTKPSSGTIALVRAWGGGGGGGIGQFAPAGGGGGGAYVEQWILLSALSSTVTVTIGAGGAARTVGPNNGNPGGSTTFGSYVTAYGGGGGSVNSGSTVGGGGGGGGGAGGAGGTNDAGNGSGNGGAGKGGTSGGAAGASGSSSTPGTAGGVGGESGGAGGGGGGSSTAGSTAAAGGAAWDGGGGGGGAANRSGVAGANGGSSKNGGGGGGGAANAATPGSGGTSTFGGNGGAGAQSSNTATSGTAPGGGGGGSFTGNSGKGGDGRVEVYVF